MRLGSISSQYFLSILRILEDMGLPRREILSVIRVAGADLFNPKCRFDKDAVTQTFNYAADRLNETNIGLQVGYRFRVHTFTETGSVLTLCSTLAEAAEIKARYQPLTETIGQGGLERREDGAYLVWNESFTDYDKYRHLTELIFAGYSTTTNWLTWGGEKGVESISFRHAPPEDLSGYELVFGGRVSFLAEENALKFNPKAVDVVLPTSNPEKLAYIRSRLDIVMQSYIDKSDIRARVSFAARQAIHDGRLSFKIIAEGLDLSDGALRILLKAEGLKYREIVEYVRRDLCHAYMRDNRSLTEIAQILGYNDQSAFTRAFKKWYGVAPSKYKPKVITI